MRQRQRIIPALLLQHQVICSLTFINHERTFPFMVFYYKIKEFFSGLAPGALLLV